MKTTINPILITLLLPAVLSLNACEKDDNTVKDADGNSYRTVKIGTQTWMAENLKTTTYNDGTPIFNITMREEWATLERPGYCDYNNDESNANKYGRLYNWYAVETGKLAPKGWHVPSKEDWDKLINYLIENGYNYDGTTSGNKIAKSLGDPKDWNDSGYEGTLGSPDYPAMDNKTHFNALPSGIRQWEFRGQGYLGQLWSSTVCNINPSMSTAYYLELDYILPNAMVEYSLKYSGMAVRCIKD